MISGTELHEKIKAWIREYGPGGMPNEKSSNLIQTLMDHKGFVPTGRGFLPVTLRTVADDVEAAVNEMAQTPAEAGDENVCFKAAMCMRVYYLTPNYWPESERLQRLKKIGLPMSRFTYYRYVQIGRAFLMGYLTSRRLEIEEARALEKKSVA